MFPLASLAIVAALASMPGGDRSNDAKPAGQSSFGVAFCACSADFDHSGVVDGADLGQLLSNWGLPAGDLNGTGITDGADLGILLAQWGACSAVATNDLCADALPIDEGTFSFCTIGAGSQGPPFPAGSSCIQFGYDSIYSDIWYAYTASAFGKLTVSTCGSGWDTRLAAYSHVFPGSVTQCPVEGFSLIGIVACNDDDASCGLGSTVTFNVIPGQLYLIRVGGYEGFADVGTLSVDFTSQGQTCETAIDLGILVEKGEDYAGTTLDNDPATDVSPCGLNDTVPEWYKFTVECPFTGPPNVVITTCDPNTDFDTVLSVWKAGASGCSGEFVACNDDDSTPGCQLNGFNRKSRVAFTAERDDVFYVRVSGYQGAKGNFVLRIEPGCN
jgi:hypothetical protein